MSTNHLHHQIDDLQRRYARALDRKDLAGWLACFGTGGGYVCTTAENDSQGLAIALMMDDSPARLKDRVKFIEKIWAGTFEDYSTRHFVQRMETAEADGVVEVETSFMISYVDKGGSAAMLATGVYRDRVEITPEGAKFRAKRAVLDAPVTPRYLVYPI